MKGIIICGYQGIGKSSWAGKGNLIDLESSNFHHAENAENWFVTYVDVAIDLARQGFVVFVSCHEKVRKQLWDKALEFDNIGLVHPIVLCPNINLENEWVLKLEERYKRTGLDKDLRSYRRAKEHFKEDIDKIIKNYKPVYALDSMDYTLDVVVKNIISELI